MTCPSCNKKVNKKFGFCPHCGDKVVKEVPVEIISPDDSSVINECDCGNNECNCSDTKPNEIVSDVNFENYKTSSEKLRRKSLFYLFSISAVFVYFSLSIVIILNQLSSLDKKVTDFQSYVYSSQYDSQPLYFENLKDGSLLFEKVKTYTEDGIFHANFYLTSYGHPTYDGKSIFDLAKKDINSFSYSIFEQLWFNNIDNASFEKHKNFTLNLYIDGVLHSYIKK